jgi:hypothetical protein
MKELPDNSDEAKELKKEESELLNHLLEGSLKEELGSLTVSLREAETSKDDEGVKLITGKIQEVHKRIRALEDYDSC